MKSATRAAANAASRLSGREVPVHPMHFTAPLLRERTRDTVAGALAIGTADHRERPSLA